MAAKVRCLRLTLLSPKAKVVVSLSDCDNHYNNNNYFGPVALTSTARILSSDEIAIEF